VTPAGVLPNRRVEGWRWSDLSAALADERPPLAAGDAHVIARLAEAAGHARRLLVENNEIHVEHLGSGPLDARALDIEVMPGAVFSTVLIQTECGVALAHRRVRLGAGARFRQFTLVTGARFARVETEVEVAGAGAAVEMNGVYLVGARMHADLTSQVILQAEGAEIRQLVRGVARKGGRGVFQGKFKVERAAQKTDAEMQHNALLLEEGAEIFAKPELEIYADDVKCSHGNTAGQLDEAAIFYLRSRGIPEVEARAMVTRAFLLEALPEWLEGEVRAEIELRINAWLGAANG
jgi:Fe-S cluster assembly protein SufD